MLGLVAKPVVEDFDGGGLIDDGFLALCVAPCLMKFFGSGDSGEGFVAEVEGEFG